MAKTIEINKIDEINVKFNSTKNKNIEIKLSDYIATNFIPLAKSFLNEEHSHYWLTGGRGSGKSTLVSILIILGIIKNPNTHAICARKFKVDLHTSVYCQMIKTIKMLGLTSMFNISNALIGAPTIIYKPTKQRIQFLGFDDPDNTKSLSAPFGIYKYSWIEEVSQLESVNKLRACLQSVRRGGEKFITFYTYNPPKSRTNWINTECSNIKHIKQYFYSESTWEDLPDALAKKWLGSDFINDANNLKTKDIISYNHEYLGHQTGYQNSVFNNIEEKILTDEEIKAFDHTISGLDFGFAKDPAAFVRCHYNKSKKILYIFDEIYKTSLLNWELAALIKEKISNNQKEIVVCDSSEPKTILELRINFNIIAIPAKKGQGSVISGIKFLQSLDKIIVDKNRCPNTLKELNEAEYETDKFGSILPCIKDKNNHSLDAIRYSLEFESNISGWRHNDKI